MTIRDCATMRVKETYGLDLTVTGEQPFAILNTGCAIKETNRSELSLALMSQIQGRRLVTVKGWARN